jgi:hypothetical protein
VTSAGNTTPALPGSDPNSTMPVTYAVTRTDTTAKSTKATSETSLATSRRVRPTGRISR